VSWGLFKLELLNSGGKTSSLYVAVRYRGFTATTGLRGNRSLLSNGDISLMWFPWTAFLGSEALNARLYPKLRKCSFVPAYKSQPSGRLGVEAATFFRNARLRSLFASLCFRYRWKRALSPLIADMVTQA
jgi:hypothetical protein